ncbi:MAG TPA: ParB/RepB/Spo0J family partition protein, partial [Mycobacterium sp.]|nr:ParB/RepB/Spo0J family partition protein [Mycobacterium sp.]
MSKPRGGLGRGLAALIPTGPDTTTVSDVLMSGGPARREPAALTLIGGGALPAPTDGQTGEAVQPGSNPDVDASSNGVGPRYRDIPIDAIRRNPRNPRSVFDEDALLELTHSIREFGMLQPVVVRDAADGGYEMVMGERRWRAA